MTALLVGVGLVALWLLVRYSPAAGGSGILGALRLGKIEEA